MLFEQVPHWCGMMSRIGRFGKASYHSKLRQRILRAPYHGSFKKVSKARRACVSASACRKASASRTPQQSCKDRLCFFVDTELTRGNLRPSYSTA